MLPKKILVATDGSEYASAALDTALHLAEKFSSSLGLLYVVNIRQLEGPLLSDLAGMVGIAPFLNFQKQVRESFYRKGEAILSSSLEMCHQKGVPAKSHLMEGVVSKVICQAAKTHDLICLGRHGEHAAWSGFLMGSSVEEVVRGSSRPVLVSGDKTRETNRMLIPYDGSQTASASLSLAVEMSTLLDASLTVLAAATNPEEGESLLDEARDYIEPRKLPGSFIFRAEDPVSSILTVIEEEGIDMVVMGAYGKGRLRELILGSTTAGVLRKVKIPVLLYR